MRVLAFGVFPNDGGFDVDQLIRSPRTGLAGREERQVARVAAQAQLPAKIAAREAGGRGVRRPYRADGYGNVVGGGEAVHSDGAAR
jgi:hypothetical protein